MDRPPKLRVDRRQAGRKRVPGRMWRTLEAPLPQPKTSLPTLAEMAAWGPEPHSRQEVQQQAAAAPVRHHQWVAAPAVRAASAGCPPRAAPPAARQSQPSSGRRENPSVCASPGRVLSCAQHRSYQRRIARPDGGSFQRRVRGSAPIARVVLDRSRNSRRSCRRGMLICPMSTARASTA